MPGLKCFVCGVGINLDTSHPNNPNYSDSSQLFKTVCSLLDLDSDLDNFILNSPLTISYAFCDNCQLIAVKLVDLQFSLLQIQNAINKTIATITKTIVQTKTQEEEEQQQKGEKKNKTVVKIPCEEDSAQCLVVEIKQEDEYEVKEEEEEETDKNGTIKLISSLRKIVYTRFSPVIKVRPCPVEININFNIKSTENSESTIENVTSADLTETENIPQRRSKRRAVKKTKFEEYVSANEEEEEEIYNDVANDDDDYSNDFEYDPSVDSIALKKPSLSSSETKSTYKKKDPDPDYQLPSNFEDDYAYTIVISEKAEPAKDAPPERKEVTRWKCPNCPSTFARARELKKHFSKFHEPDVQLAANFKEDCTYTKVLWQKPLGAPQSKEVTRWKCPNCPSSFSRGSDLRRHYIKNHGPDIEIKTKKLRSEPIPEKPGFFMYAEKWEYEMKEDPETGTIFICSTCGVRRRAKTEMKKHLDRFHNLTLKWPCSKCEKAFVNEWYFKSHNCVPRERKKHHKVKELPDGSFIYDDEHRFVKIDDDDDESDVEGTGFQFQCCVCETKRKLYHLMVGHMRTQHALVNAPKGSLCSECGMAFSTGTLLRNHIKNMHSTEFDYYCEICGRGCKTKGILFYHKQRAHSEPSFKCATEGCPKIYRTNAVLVKHCRRNGHSLPPPSSDVSCSLCGTKFHNARGRQVHEARCTGVKKQTTTKTYSCRECKKPFFNQQLRKQHEFSHNIERQAALSSTSTATTIETTTTNETEATVTSSQSTTEEMKTVANEQDSVMNEQDEQFLPVQSTLNFTPQNQLFELQDSFTLSVFDKMSGEN